MAGEKISSIEIRKAGNEEYYFVFRLPSDGLFVSIFFDSLAEVVAAAEYSQRNSADDTRYLSKTKATGEDYFVFLTKGNKPIGQSTMFEQAPTMNDGMQYMQKHLKKSQVLDLTT